jgi:uncharacterized coiled-coil protein SlyX
MAASQSNIQSLSTKVADLQKDMAQVGTLVDRLDITIEKLTEVSTTVSQLLAVQGSRLEFQEKVAERLQEVVEKRRQETDNNIRELYVRIEKVESDLHGDIDRQNERVIDEIKSLRADGEKQHKEMNERITRLEKWMWTVVGAVLVVSFLFDKVNISILICYYNPYVGS